MGYFFQNFFSGFFWSGAPSFNHQATFLNFWRNRVMPSPRKYIPNGSVVFATASLEQGLLLLSNPLCITMLKSCLARSLSLYKVRLCHFIINSNHIHLVFVVINPSDASNFMGHFKAEVAHRLNTIMGWQKRTVWCEGYDSPVILSAIKALMTIAYLYSNPAKDYQEDTISKYPGLSSWNMFITGKHKANWKYIKRPAFKFMPKDAHNPEGYRRAAKRLLSLTKLEHEFELEPNAWLEAFGIKDLKEQKEWNNVLIKRVRTLEQRARETRQIQKKSIIGRAKLLTQKLTLNFQSQRSGKRMWCLSHKRIDRVNFINKLKVLIAEAREVFRLWHSGDYKLAYPAGLFPPSMPKLIEPVGVLAFA